MKTNLLDKYSRVLAVFDQLPNATGEQNDLRKIVGKIAAYLRDEWAGVSDISQYAQTMQATYPAGSKEWAVLGCVLNILNPPTYHSHETRN